MMNNEIIKAMNRKPKKNTFRKWWNKNGYKVNRVIFFPHLDWWRYCRKDSKETQWSPSVE